VRFRTCRAMLTSARAVLSHLACGRVMLLTARGDAHTLQRYQGCDSCYGGDGPARAAVIAASYMREALWNTTAEFRQNLSTARSQSQLARSSSDISLLTLDRRAHHQKPLRDLEIGRASPAMISHSCALRVISLCAILWIA